MSQDSYFKFFERHSKKSDDFISPNSNELISTDILIARYKERNQHDYLKLKYDIADASKCEIKFIFASHEINQKIDIGLPFNFHIDSTFKLIIHKYAYYIMSTKFAKTHSVPLLHFVIKPDNSENIKYCLRKYFKWSKKSPKYFISDCALNIFNAIYELFKDNEEVKIFWCSLHVIRALRSNREKFNGNNELFNKVLKKMNYLNYARSFDEIICNNIIKRIKELISDNKELSEYFEKQWFNHEQQWVVSYKPKDVPLTNNISESLFRKVKYYDFGGHLHMKFDYFVFLLITKISPTYLVTLNNDITLKSEVKLPIVINNTPVPKITPELEVIYEAKQKLKSLSKLLMSGKVNVKHFITFVEKIPEKLMQIDRVEQEMFNVVRRSNATDETKIDIYGQISDFINQNDPHTIFNGYKNFMLEIKGKYHLEWL